MKKNGDSLGICGLRLRMLIVIAPLCVLLFGVVSPGLLANTKVATLVLCRGAGAGHVEGIVSSCRCS